MCDQCIATKTVLWGKKVSKRRDTICMTATKKSESKNYFVLYPMFLYLAKSRSMRKSCDCLSFFIAGGPGARAGSGR